MTPTKDQIRSDLDKNINGNAATDQHINDTVILKTAYDCTQEAPEQLITTNKGYSLSDVNQSFLTDIQQERVRDTITPLASI